MWGKWDFNKWKQKIPGSFLKANWLSINKQTIWGLTSVPLWSPYNSAIWEKWKHIQIKTLIINEKGSFPLLSTWSTSPIQQLKYIPLTDHDSWRWNRNFYIKHLHKEKMTFDQITVWCFDIKFASKEQAADCTLRS